MRRLPALGLVLASCLWIGLSCSEDDPITTPESPTVELTGTVELPGGSGGLDQVRVGLGEHEVEIDDAGGFAITGNRHIPGLAMAYRDSVPLLLCAHPDPGDGRQITLSLRSTAKALAFMTPLICVSHREGATEILDRMETLPQLDVLESLLGSKLAADPNALGAEDQETIEAVADVVIAYLQTYPETLVSYKPSLLGFAGGHRAGPVEQLADPAEHVAGSAQQTTYTAQEETEIYVLPTTQTNGHELTHLEEDRFKITNAYGRWAFCITESPADTVLLSPNGGMFEFFRGRYPWSPSERQIEFEVPGDDRDSTHVRVIGYGFQPLYNPWDTLTDEEKRLAHLAGMWTIVFEFAGNVFSVATNTESVVHQFDGISPTESNWKMELLSVVLTDYPVMAQVESALREGEYWEVVWLVANKVLENVTFNTAYRASFEYLLDRSVGPEAVKKLGQFVGTQAVMAPAMGFIIGNQVTTAMKTMVGLQKSKFKTEFTIWQEAEKEFGVLMGSVHERSLGTPIEGATVTIHESGENPIHGHQTTQITGADGGFYFENVLVGNVTVTAEKEGFSAASKTAIVADGATTEVLLELDEESGFATGLIRNGIKLKIEEAGEPIESTLFAREAYLRARATLDGEEVLVAGSTEDGQFQLELAPGLWSIRAEHPAYHPDSVQVTVVVDETTVASRDLVMVPADTMFASIYLEGIGSTIQTPLELVGASPVLEQEEVGKVLFIIAGNVSSPPEEELVFMLDLLSVTSASSYVLTSWEQFEQSPGSGRGGVLSYITNRTRCTHEGSTYSMRYELPGDPDDAYCDCGIEENGCGSFYLTEFGTEIGDVIAGAVIAAKMPSYENCLCYNQGSSSNPDYSHVTCTRGQFDLDFRIVVGSAAYLPLQGVLTEMGTGGGWAAAAQGSQTPGHGRPTPGEGWLIPAQSAWK